MDDSVCTGLEAMDIVCRNALINKSNKPRASLDCLSKNIISLLLNFMELKTIISFSMTSKRNKKIVEALNGIFFREITQILFTSEPDMYCDYADYSGYTKFIKMKNKSFINILNHQPGSEAPRKEWLVDLKKISELKRKWKEMLQQLTVDEEETENFVSELFGALREPPMPTLKLKRETVGRYSKSWFQNKLCDVLYEGPSPFFMCERKDVFEPLLSLEKQFVDEINGNETQKKAFLNARWYEADGLPETAADFDNMNFLPPLELEPSSSYREENRNYYSSFSNKEYFSNHMVLEEVEEQGEKYLEISTNKMKMTMEEEVEEEEEKLNQHDTFRSKEMLLPCLSLKTHNSLGFSKKNVLIRIYETLYETVDFFTEIIHDFLKIHNNPYDLLLEYSQKWTVFVATMSELELSFKSFEEIFNNLYENVFVDYPSYPKFSCWRLMTVLWTKNVYRPLEEELNKAFFSILSFTREKNLEFMMNETKLEFNDEYKNRIMPKGFENIPLNLYLSYKSEAQKKDAENSCCSPESALFDSERFSHEFFSKSHSSLLNLLSNYMQNVLDLSINEISVHYLGHSQLDVEEPFLNLEEKFLKDTEMFYTEKRLLFKDHPSYYDKLLSTDLNFMSNILNEKTQCSLEKIWNESWLKYIRSWTLTNILENSNQDCLDLPKNKEQELRIFIQEVLKDCQANWIGVKSFLFDKNINYEEIPSQEAIKLGFFAQHYEILKGYKERKLNDPSENIVKCTRDSELEDINKYRKIPLRLNEKEKLFYSVNSPVARDFVERIFEEFIANLNTHSRDNSENGDDDNRNGDLMSNNEESLETYNEDDQEFSQGEKSLGLVKLSKNTSNISTSYNSNEISEEKSGKVLEKFPLNNGVKANNADLSDEEEEFEEPPRLGLKRC